jgi:hypothetical protein
VSSAAFLPSPGNVILGGMQPAVETATGDQMFMAALFHYA